MTDVEPDPPAVPSLVELLAPVRGRLVAAVALGALGAAATVGGTALLAHTVGGLLAAPSPPGLLGRCVVAGLVVVAGFATTKAASAVSHGASHHLEVALRRDLAEAVARMPLGEVQRLGAARLATVVGDDVRSLHSLVADSTPMVGATVATPLAAIVATALTQWLLLPVVLLLVPAVMWGVRRMGRDFPAEQARFERAGEQVSAAVVEFAQGMPVIRTFDDGRSSFRRYAASVREYSAAVADWTASGRRVDLGTRLLASPLPTVAVIAALGAMLVALDLVTVPQLVVALVIGALPVESFLPLLYMVDYLRRSRAGADGIARVLAVPPLPEPADPRAPAGGDVELDRVGFAYEPGRQALVDVSITVPAGTTCALVGASGSGKSTVARLVPRFFDVDAGAVRVGGVDVRDMSSAQLLSHVTLVFQDPFLVEGTVAENIRLSRPDADDGEVREAARVAAAHDFIVGELPAGYDSPVGERGSLLSGGQRQRITIARAVLSRAPVVVLDEATAFADPETEAEVLRGIEGLTTGRTVLVVAHRLHTVVDADQVVVLDRGRVVESGTVPDLRARDGHFARLWEAHERAARWGLAGRDHEEVR